MLSFKVRLYTKFTQPWKQRETPTWVWITKNNDAIIHRHPARWIIASLFLVILITLHKWLGLKCENPTIKLKQETRREYFPQVRSEHSIIISVLEKQMTSWIFMFYDKWIETGGWLKKKNKKNIEMSTHIYELKHSEGLIVPIKEDLLCTIITMHLFPFFYLDWRCSPRGCKWKENWCQLISIINCSSPSVPWCQKETISAWEGIDECLNGGMSSLWLKTRFKNAELLSAIQQSTLIRSKVHGDYSTSNEKKL